MSFYNAFQKKTRSKINKVDFVEFAILRLVYDIPTRGLKTIEDSLDLLQTHDIQAISITGKVFQKNSGPLGERNNILQSSYFIPTYYPEFSSRYLYIQRSIAFNKSIMMTVLVEL